MNVSDWLLLCAVALAWYHVGFVWLVQVVAWPLFAYVGKSDFDAYHWAWWRGIRYVLFVPSGLAFLATVLLFFFHPSGVPTPLLVAAITSYVLAYVTTAVWFGPQQAKLTDTSSPQFAIIVRTHWVRTALVTLYAVCLLGAVAGRLA